MTRPSHFLPLPLLAFLVLGLPSRIAGQTAHQVSVIAHRGAALEAPENTLPAIEAAVRMGCDIVEVDVRLSQDGRVVLIHDATVDRTTAGRGRVDALSWARLRELDAGAAFSKGFRGTRIPLLEEAISVVRGRAILYLDVKVTDFEPIVRVVRKEEFSKSVLYRAYRPQDIDRIRRLDPDARVIIDIGQLGLLPGASDVVLAGHPDAILSLDLSSCGERHQAVIRAHASRWFVNVLGSPSPADLRRALDLHPTGIMTDSPRLLLELLGR